MSAGSRTLAIACIAEAATGAALLAMPSFVASILLGAELAGPEVVIARVAAVALIALAIACRPDPQRGRGQAFAAMVLYNLSAALLLIQAVMGGTSDGRLLWPTAGVHLLLAVLLVISWSGVRNGRGRLTEKREEPVREG